MPKQGEHLAFLDGLRGYAALWVMLAHCMIWGGWYGVPLPDAKLAVDVFMVLSGFLMVYHWPGHDLRVTGWEAARFWLRRFFRIAPLYYAVFAVWFVLQGPLVGGMAAMQNASRPQWGYGGPYDASLVRFDHLTFATNMTFIFGLFPGYGGTGFSGGWSISLEMQFYALFPLLLILWRKWGYILLGCAALIAMAVSDARLGPHFTEPSLLPFKLPIFLVGMFLVPLLARFRPPEWLLPELLKVDRIFSGPIQSFMGDVSYGVYLFHPVAIFLAGAVLYRSPWFLVHRPFVRTAMLAALVIPSSYLIAWVLYWAVEKPGIAAGKRVTEGQPSRGTDHPGLLAR